jgi:hypothetical protein
MRAILRMSHDPFVGIGYILPSFLSLANTAKMSINLFQILVGFGRAVRPHGLRLHKLVF